MIPRYLRIRATGAPSLVAYLLATDRPASLAAPHTDLHTLLRAMLAARE